MESAPPSAACFLGRRLIGGGLKCRPVIVRLLPSPSQRLYPASCRMRQRNFSLHNKKQNAKKINIEDPSNKNLQPNVDQDADPGNLSNYSTSNSDQETDTYDRLPIIKEVNYSNEKGDNDSPPQIDGSSLHNDNVDSMNSSDSRVENASSSFLSNDFASDTIDGDN